jgi:SAM-dependent methyltransferase
MNLEERIMSRSETSRLDVDRLQSEIRSTYEQVAGNPDGDFHFHRGPDYAHRFLKYDREELETLPDLSTRRFAGVGNPHRIRNIEPGEIVLDIGCGAGMDLLLAARRTGPGGRVIGVEPTPAMRQVALEAARLAGLDDRVEVREGLAEALPLPDASIDTVISNGVLNLTPDKTRAFREIFRVLRPGGRLQIADVLLDGDLHDHERADVDLWAGCVAGALRESELLAVIEAVGCAGGRITERFDAYAGTPVAATVASAVGVHGGNFLARKPKG